MAAHKGTVVAAGRDVLGEVGFEADREVIVELHQKHISRKKGAEDGGKDALPITVVIDDGNGYRSVYTHLTDVAVKPGRRSRRARSSARPARAAVWRAARSTTSSCGWTATGNAWPRRRSSGWATRSGSANTSIRWGCSRWT